ncbi:MAG: PD-(D/E)XK nuclease family protein [Desulfovibrionaceae bacterium]
MSDRAIKIVDWRADFIRELGQTLAQADPRTTMAIFPHRRPALYLKRFFATEPGLSRPRLLPALLSFEDFIGGLRRDLAPRPLRPAKRLDQAGLLYDIAVRLQHEESGPLSDLPLERERFLPWGVRLASLLEELLRQGVEPDNLLHLEGEVIDWAAALLANLGHFHAAYVQKLETRGWTTPGLDCRLVTSQLDQVVDLLRGKEILAAGFYALSGSEDALFRRLWQDDLLDIHWHTDPSLTQGESGHPAVVEHRNWLRRWRARPVQTGPRPHPDAGPRITFYEGFDLHSQLSALRDELSADPDAADTAIVLPDEGALLPVLHHLPDREINVSMGYPLERTALYQLVECVLRCQENRDETAIRDGLYYWRDVIELLRHPYMKMLRADNGMPLRTVLQWQEFAVRSGEPMQNPMQWIPPYGEAPLDDLDSESVEPLRLALLGACLDGFESVSSLETLAKALQHLAGLLLRQGRHLWKSYVTDAEYLARLLTSVVPQLLSSSLSRDTFSRGTLFALFRQLCRAERVSFEAEPLTGLQVMGVLETRLLKFRRLFVLDAVEERLPGTNPVDPLLPDALRGLLGLPDARERDNVSAYNFHRLVMGADQAVLLYQCGVQPGALEGKSVRSRYVEQLLWEQEKALGQLIRPGDAPPLRAVRYRSDPIRPGLNGIHRTPALQARLLEHLDTAGLSLSQLDCFLRCPKKFYYSVLAAIKPVREMLEDNDHAGLGSVVHETLHAFFTPYLGQHIDPAVLDNTELSRLYENRLETSDFFPRMPLDAQRALLEAGKMRLRTFLANQQPTQLLGLELATEGHIQVNDRRIRLHGRLDRVDRRDKGILVLDYKTGTVHKPRRGFWDNDRLWERLAQPDPDDRELLRELQHEVQELQLPAYLHMYLEQQGEPPYDAAWVELKGKGTETNLFPSNWTEEERIEAVRDQCRTLLEAVALLLMQGGTFAPQEGPYCEYCDYRGPCGR